MNGDWPVYDLLIISYKLGNLGWWYSASCGFAGPAFRSALSLGFSSCSTRSPFGILL